MIMKLFLLLAILSTSICGAEKPFCPISSPCDCAYSDNHHIILKCKNENLIKIPPISSPGHVNVADFSDNRIKRIRINDFKGLKCDELKLRNNRLLGIQKSSLLPLRENLKKLDLSKNQFKSFPVLALKKLHNLDYLNLAQTVSKLPGKIFINMKKLETLIISDNKLKTLSRTFFLGLENSLKTLTLSNNAFNDFPVAIRSLTSLKYLTLSNCGLSNIPNKAFVDLRNIVHLDLSRNNFKEPNSLKPEMFSNIENSLKVLNLRICGLTAFPNSIRYLRNLTDLDLYGNSLHHISKDDWLNLDSLKNLNIGGNLFPLSASLFEYIGDTLMYLNLGHSEYSNLPDDFLSTFQRLDTIDLRNNKFTTIPKTFSQKSPVNRYILDFNPIETIHEDAFSQNVPQHTLRISLQFSNIKHLNFSHCGFSEINIRGARIPCTCDIYRLVAQNITVHGLCQHKNSAIRINGPRFWQYYSYKCKHHSIICQSTFNPSLKLTNITSVQTPHFTTKKKTTPNKNVIDLWPDAIDKILINMINTKKPSKIIFIGPSKSIFKKQTTKTETMTFVSEIKSNRTVLSSDPKPTDDKLITPSRSLVNISISERTFAKPYVASKMLLATCSYSDDKLCSKIFETTTIRLYNITAATTNLFTSKTDVYKTSTKPSVPLYKHFTTNQQISQTIITSKINSSIFPSKEKTIEISSVRLLQVPNETKTTRIHKTRSPVLDDFSKKEKTKIASAIVPISTIVDRVQKYETTLDNVYRMGSGATSYRTKDQTLVLSPKPIFSIHHTNILNTLVYRGHFHKLEPSQRLAQTPVLNLNQNSFYINKDKNTIGLASDLYRFFTTTQNLHKKDFQLNSKNQTISPTDSLSYAKINVSKLKHEATRSFGLSRYLSKLSEPVESFTNVQKRLRIRLMSSNLLEHVVRYSSLKASHDRQSLDNQMLTIYEEDKMIKINNQPITFQTEFRTLPKLNRILGNEVNNQPPSQTKVSSFALYRSSISANVSRHLWKERDFTTKHKTSPHLYSKTHNIPGVFLKQKHTNQNQKVVLIEENADGAPQTVVTLNTKPVTNELVEQTKPLPMISPKPDVNRIELVTYRNFNENNKINIQYQNNEKLKRDRQRVARTETNQIPTNVNEVTNKNDKSVAEESNMNGRGPTTKLTFSLLSVLVIFVA